MEIHRLLDEAFADIDVTADVQDLKEEMRANLVVRVAELEATGTPEDEAARRAMVELGDVRSIVDEMEAAPTHAVGPPPGPAQARLRRPYRCAVNGRRRLWSSRRCSPGAPRPRSAGWPSRPGVLALVAGVIVADALRQETTTNYPVPRPRALGYGAAAAVGVAGLGIGALYLRDQRLALVVGGGLAVLLSVVWFTYLGVTQTNRHKPWVVRLAAEHRRAGDRFEQDPAAAARFGLYTVTIWIVAIAAFGGAELHRRLGLVLARPGGRPGGDDADAGPHAVRTIHSGRPPVTVRAALVDPEAPGGIRLGPVAAPRPGPGQVLVDVHHVSLNRGDLNDVRSGRVPAGAVLGSDLAGVVARSTPGGAGPAVGTRVVALTARRVRDTGSRSTSRRSRSCRTGWTWPRRPRSRSPGWPRCRPSGPACWRRRSRGPGCW